MAKRHHESHAHRKHSSMGHHTAGMEPNRRHAMEDMGMIHEDHSQVANLPQNVMMKSYPQVGPYEKEFMDDTIRGVDRQIDKDDSMRQKLTNPHKY